MEVYIIYIVAIAYCFFIWGVMSYLLESWRINVIFLITLITLGSIRTGMRSEFINIPVLAMITASLLGIWAGQLYLKKKGKKLR